MSCHDSLVVCGSNTWPHFGHVTLHRWVLLSRDSPITLGVVSISSFLLHNCAFNGDRPYGCRVKAASITIKYTPIKPASQQVFPFA